MHKCSEKLLAWFNLYEVTTTWIIGLVLILSGIPHWNNPYFFLGSIYSYHLVTPGIGQTVALSLPLIQLVVGTCLLARKYLNAARLASLLLFFCFASVQSIAYIRGLDISCGCFGPRYDTEIGFQSLAIVYSLLFFSFSQNVFYVMSNDSSK